MKKKILTIGAGSAGVNIAKKIATAVPNVAVAAIDTDIEHLKASGIPHSMPIGMTATKGCGTGGDHFLGKSAAAENAEDIQKLAQAADFIIIVCGLGGGTGSMVAPIITTLARNNATIITFCVSPLKIEGKERCELAQKALNFLKKKCSAVFELPNDLILARQSLPITEAYEAANDYILKAVKSMADMLSNKGIVNIDFPTFGKIFSKKDVDAFIAYGQAEGENFCDNAVEDMANSPLLASLANRKVDSLLLSITCGENFEMNKMQYILERAARRLGADSQGRIAFAASVNKRYGDKLEICAMGVYAEGFYDNIQTPPPPHQELAPASTAQTDELEDSDELETNEDVNTFSNSERVSEESQTVINTDPSTSSSQPSEPTPIPVAEEKKKAKRGFLGFGGKPKEKDTDTSPKTTSQPQGEFKFMEMSEQRGYFDETEKNIRNGEDLDVPTYMRRNIKINA